MAFETPPDASFSRTSSHRSSSHASSKKMDPKSAPAAKAPRLSSAPKAPTHTLPSLHAANSNIGDEPSQNEEAVCIPKAGSGSVSEEQIDQLSSAFESPIPADEDNKIVVAENESHNVNNDAENAGMEAASMLQTLLPLEDYGFDVLLGKANASREENSSNPVTTEDTKTVVYSEQTSSSSNTAALPGSKEEEDLEMKQDELDVIFAEHLKSEQEGFLFSKAEPVFQAGCTESLPLEDCTLIRPGQEAAYLSQFGAALRACDLKAAAAILEAARNEALKASSLPLEAAGVIDAAFTALANNLLAKVSSCPEQRTQAGSFRQISRQTFLAVSFLVPTCFLCIMLWFVWSMNSESQSLPPT